MVITLEEKELAVRTIDGVRFVLFHGHNEDMEGFLIWLDISAVEFDSSWTIVDDGVHVAAKESYSGEAVRHASQN